MYTYIFFFEKKKFLLMNEMNKMQYLHNWISNIRKLFISDNRYKIILSSFWIKKQIAIGWTQLIGRLC